MSDLKGNFTIGPVPPEYINTKRHYFGQPKQPNQQSGTNLQSTGRNSNCLPNKATRPSETSKSILPTKSILHNRDTLQSSVSNNPFGNSLGQQFNQLKQSINPTSPYRQDNSNMNVNMNSGNMNMNLNSGNMTNNNQFNSSTGMYGLKSNPPNSNPLANSLINQNPLLGNTNQFNSTMQSGFNNTLQSPYTNPYAIPNETAKKQNEEVKSIVNNMKKLTQREGFELEQVLNHHFKDKMTIHQDVLKDYLKTTFILTDKEAKAVLDNLTVDNLNNIKTEAFFNLVLKNYIPDVKNIFEENILNDPMYSSQQQHNIRYGEDNLLSNIKI
jgi:hypothetical protein